jgi:hypothetical protein
MASRSAKTGAVLSESVWGLLGAILIGIGMETGIVEDGVETIDCGGLFHAATAVDDDCCGTIESARIDLAGGTRKMLSSSTGSVGYCSFVFGKGNVNARDITDEDIRGLMGV